MNNIAFLKSSTAEDVLLFDELIVFLNFFTNNSCNSYLLFNTF